MSAILRRATAADAPHIARIIQQAFGDEADPHHIERILVEDDHFTIVADVQSQVMGFLDAFLTLSQTGERRMELDLLAIHPQHQKQGLGQRLIQQVVAEGSHYPQTAIRALVAASNTAMQRAMIRQQFQRQPILVDLYISDLNESDPVVVPDGAYLLPVNTLTYRGIWLEGTLSTSGIQAARYARTVHQLDTIGVLVSSSDSNALELLRSAGMMRIGSYHWWVYHLR